MLLDHVGQACGVQTESPTSGAGRAALRLKQPLVCLQAACVLCTLCTLGLCTETMCQCSTAGMRRQEDSKERIIHSAAQRAGRSLVFRGESPHRVPANVLPACSPYSHVGLCQIVFLDPPGDVKVKPSLNLIIYCTRRKMIHVIY